MAKYLDVDHQQRPPDDTDADGLNRSIRVKEVPYIRSNFALHESRLHYRARVAEYMDIPLYVKILTCLRKSIVPI